MGCTVVYKHTQLMKRLSKKKIMIKRKKHQQKNVSCEIGDLELLCAIA